MSIENFYISIINEVALSSREWAIVTWIIMIIVLAVILLWKQKQLDSLYSLVKHIFSAKLLVPTLLYFSWFILGNILLYKIGIWDLRYLKTGIIWFLFEGLVVFYAVETANRAQKLKGRMKEFIGKSLSISTLVAIIINLHTFNYFMELILVLLIFLCGIFISFFKYTEESNKLFSSCLNVFISVALLLLLVFSLSNFLSDFEISNINEVFTEYLLLILYSFWVIPAVYSIRIFAIYELIWLRLRFIKYIPKNKKKLLKLGILKNCHIDFNKLEKFYIDTKWKSMKFESKKEIEEYFLWFNNQYKQVLKDKEN